MPPLTLLTPLVLIALTIFGTAPAQAADRLLAAPGQCAHDSGGAPAAQERAMRCLINVARARAGLPRLSVDGRLQRSAALKNAWMLGCNQFSHTPCSRAFTAAFRTVHYAGGSYGENIAYGTSYLGSPRRILTSWLASPGHRANILRRGWHSQGVAVRHDTFLGYANAAVWTSQFGSR